MKLICSCTKFVYLLCFISLSATCGDRIVVRSSDQPFDAFAVRDQILREHEWQESLRLQQQIRISEALPLGCHFFTSPYHYYVCGQDYFRPYTMRDQELFIQIDPVKK